MAQAVAALALPIVLARAQASESPRDAGSAPPPAPAVLARADSVEPFSVRQLAPGAYAVPGDSGRGVEGRANAGFVVTPDGVVAIDALGSPLQGRRLLASIRTVTDLPVRWLILTHHHPDHAFGAIVFEREGAEVVAHPDDQTQVSSGGDSAYVAEWTRVVGEAEMQGFALADQPDIPVTRDTTLTPGGEPIVVGRPGAAHTAGDLYVWLPEPRVLYAGDLLVEDGITMVSDGSSAVLGAALDRLLALRPAMVVPGHGRIPDDPQALIDRTRAYVEGLRTEMREAFEEGKTLGEVVAELPPADPERPVSPESRLRRNAVRVYVEIEREEMGLEPDHGADEPPAPAARTSEP
jgi:glyoxylase-like metal-dependent hydrolase (beta-lactamase superfamily II)